jgi:hypothetical protein
MLGSGSVGFGFMFGFGGGFFFTFGSVLYKFRYGDSVFWFQCHSAGKFGCGGSGFGCSVILQTFFNGGALICMPEVADDLIFSTDHKMFTFVF